MLNQRVGFAASEVATVGRQVVAAAFTVANKSHGCVTGPCFRSRYMTALCSLVWKK